MTQTRWTAEGPDGTSRELGGHKFASNDKGELMTYRSLNGKRVYIACSRAADGCSCDGADVQHINDRLTPNPDKPKDASAITHGLYWRRLRTSSVLLLRSFE